VRLSERPGIGVFQARGMPAAFTALTVKKTIAARLKIVVTIAMKLLSILKRAKTRRTKPLCSSRAVNTPTLKSATKAIKPRNET
jgi:hypothetical protein